MARQAEVVEVMAAQEAPLASVASMAELEVLSVTMQGVLCGTRRGALRMDWEAREMDCEAALLAALLGPRAGFALHFAIGTCSTQRMSSHGAPLAGRNRAIEASRRTSDCHGRLCKDCDMRLGAGWEVQQGLVRADEEGISAARVAGRLANMVPAEEVETTGEVVAKETARVVRSAVTTAGRQ